MKQGHPLTLNADLLHVWWGEWSIEYRQSRTTVSEQGFAPKTKCHTLTASVCVSVRTHECMCYSDCFHKSFCNQGNALTTSAWPPVCLGGLDYLARHCCDEAFSYVWSIAGQTGAIDHLNWDRLTIVSFGLKKTLELRARWVLLF